MTLQDKLAEIRDAINRSMQSSSNTSSGYITLNTDTVAALLVVAEAAARRADATKTVEWIDKYPDTKREDIWKEDGRSITNLEKALAALEAL